MVEGLNAAIFPAITPAADKDAAIAFCKRLIADIQPALEAGTGSPWHLHYAEGTALADDTPRSPADFLDDASLRMAEGPYDLVIVVTDAPLVSSLRQVVGGLASPLCRVAVLSLRKLLVAPRGKPVRTLDSDAARWNGAALAVHLVGHLLGLRHGPAGAMREWSFEEDREAVEPFGERDAAWLRRWASRLPEDVLSGWHLPRLLLFHLRMAARHPAPILRTLARNRAPLLPLYLPSLATAAVAPTFLLVFTAEIWDVGMNLPDRINAGFSLAVLVGATLYLIMAQSLFFPSQEQRRITEHTAVLNVAILLSVFAAMSGLFLMVGLLMLLIEVYVFPPGLIAKWATLPGGAADTWDKVRLAAFIATIGTITGSLAGGADSRDVIRRLSLFESRP